MFPFLTDTQNVRSGWLEAETREIIQRAEREARRSGHFELTIEHLLLVACRDARTRPLLTALAVDIPAVSALLMEEIARSSDLPLTGNAIISLSYDAQQCIDHAIAVVVYQRRAPLVLPAHLLLSILSLEKVQFLLTGYLPAIENCIDQLGREELFKEDVPVFEELLRVERDSILSAHHILNAITASEHPLIRLTDVMGINRSRREVQTLIERLTPAMEPFGSMKDVPRTILFVGQPVRERRLLAEIVAGEIGCPLVSLSFPGLAAILSVYDTLPDERIVEQGGETASPVLHLSPYGVHIAQDLLQRFFSLARRRSPCILFIEDIDALERIQSPQTREQLLGMLTAELDILFNEQRQVIVLASARQTQLLDATLYMRLHSTHFLYRVLVDQRTHIRLATQSPVCLSCSHVISSGWKHCAYCGACLRKICPRCETPQPDQEDVRFCSTCGYMLS